jgi:hypothetical protein
MSLAGTFVSQLLLCIAHSAAAHVLCAKRSGACYNGIEQANCSPYWGRSCRNAEGASPIASGLRRPVPLTGEVPLP